MTDDDAGNHNHNHHDDVDDDDDDDDDEDTWTGCVCYISKVFFAGKVLPKVPGLKFRPQLTCHNATSMVTGGWHGSHVDTGFWGEM